METTSKAENKITTEKTVVDITKEEKVTERSEVETGLV